MIGWEDIYKVVESMAPLYVALMLGYGSVRWWNIFTPEQGGAINRFVCFFTLPLFTFQFTAHVNPFNWNYLFIAADAISKLVIVTVLASWNKFSSKGSYSWSITNFSLCTLTSSLVVGVPLGDAMYGQMGVNLIVQSSVLQAIIWLTLLLFVLEFRRTGLDIYSNTSSSGDSRVKPVELGNINDLEGNMDMVESTSTSISSKPSFWSFIKVVGQKLAANPNSYAVFIGIVWALISNRWHFQMPSIMEGSILIMSNAGTGTAMFSMAGPVAMAIGCFAVGLHGDVLRVSIIQAALPQSITSFIFAKEYGLHADVLSTAVIFGMLVSLPVLIAYCAILGFVN
ncbi:hypothetical protein FNV43_RR02882 [Rhamnella rubrinervis]|uniref:Auxin efflux carrier component n=1 Tax=Rhamnella rubrinervis TaxID=2594499 RepID=A0A8K0MNI2_9ROSA|nr:hypothetical protein FNV43_RR02882 [Rhamnella rubrinervis]